MKEYMIIPAMLLMLAGCNKTTDATISFVSQSHGNASKVTLDGLDFKWAAGDQIAVYSYKEAGTMPVGMDLCSLSSTPGFAHGAFTPQTRTFGTGWVTEGDAADTYYFYAWYPASATPTGTSETVANVAAVQAEGHLSDYLLCWAQGSKPKTRAQVIAGITPSFSFTPQVTVLKLALHNSTDETVIVNGLHVKTDKGFIAGEVALNVKTGAVSGGTSSTIDYTPAQPIVIPAGATSATHTLVMLPSSGKLTITAGDTAGNVFALAASTPTATIAGGCYPVNLDITGYDKAVLAHDAEDFVNGLYYYGEANCLLMPAGQLSATLDVSLYKAGVDYARGSRTAQYHSAVDKARVIWYEEGDESSGLILNEPTLSNEKGIWTMTVTASKNMGGNALVGLYDEADNLLWSFHVWAPVTTRHEESNELVALSLALGQVTSATDTYMYYQWGRKDPMGRAPNYVSKEPKKLFYMAEGTAPYGAKPSLGSVEEGPKSLDEARRHPTVFYTTESETVNWFLETEADPDKNLWSANYKTLYDPCPRGYRITPKEMWIGISSSNYNSTSPARYEYNDLTYVTGGGRLRNGGKVYGLREWGYYWTGETIENQGVYLHLYSGSSSRYNTKSCKTYGYAVRCIKN